jgi:hypothetical protein
MKPEVEPSRDSGIAARTDAEGGGEEGPMLQRIKGDGPSLILS